MAVEVALDAGERPRRPGRPPAITPEVERDLMIAIERGLTISDACMVVGIGAATFHRHASMFPEFRENVYRARRRKVLALAEMAEQAMQVAIASGDWRAPLAALKFALQRLDREHVHEDPRQASDGVDPVKVAAVVRILRRMETEDGDGRDPGAESDGAAGAGGEEPVHPGHPDPVASRLPGQS